MFTSRIPLPKNPDEAATQAETRNQWLPRQAGHTGLKFANGLEMAHDSASRATEAYNCPLDCVFDADGVQIKTDGELSPKAITAILDDSKPWPKTGQPLRFANRTAVSHSDESRALAAYANSVDKGRTTVKGMTAVFTGPDGTKIEGIQANRAKLSKLLKA
jgi:hypothetical protein